MKRALSRRLVSIAILLAMHLAGCGTSAPTRDASPSRESVVELARNMLGRPYRYGGTTPRGFDCSGLVYYTHTRLGIDVPRTARAQYGAVRRVARDALRPGDLLFFRLSGWKVSHVAIYTGDDRFIHAPATGKHVAYGDLRNPFWRKRFIRAGRIL